MSTLRVLIAAPPMMRGGTERQLIHLAARLAPLNVEAAFVLLAPNGPLEPELIATGTRVIRPIAEANRPLRTWVQAQLIAREIRRWRPQVLHSFLSEPHFAAALGIALAGEGRPLLVHGRRSTNFYAVRRPLAAALERHLHKYCAALIGNSTALARELTAEAGASDKVGVIHNGIPLAEGAAQPSRAEARARLGLPLDVFVMAVVANLFGYKRHADVLSALAKIALQLPTNWRLLLAGRDAGEQARLEAQAQATGLARHVVFLGEVADTAPLHAATDVELLVSVQEGLSNALLEAMAAGVPAIVSDSGGNPDAVIHETTGLIVPTGNINAIAAAILALADDPGMRQRYGAAARERAEHYFSMEVCAQRHAKLWRGLVERGGAPLGTWFGGPSIR